MDSAPFDNMKIRPEILAVLEQMPATDMENIAEARRNLEVAKQTIKNSGSAAHPLEEKLKIRDYYIPNVAGAPDIQIRHYTPLAPDEKAPCLVLFHGGAFVFGDLDSEHIRCLHIAARCNSTVISVDYRLAPEHPFPTGVNDCYTALSWAAENAQKLGIDPTRIAVGGASAGGALAAAVSQMARDRGGPDITFQLLIYPVLDDRMDSSSMAKGANRPIWNSHHTRLMWQHYLTSNPKVKPTPNYAAPGRATNLAGLPSAFILTAEFDPLRDEALDYALRLIDEEVTTELHQIPGTVHGFDLLECGGVADEALDLQVHAFNRVMQLK